MNDGGDVEQGKEVAKQPLNSHLKQYEFKPGQSGNPAGRPPNKKYLSELAREMLKETRKGDLSGKTTDELVVLALVKQALRGDTKAIGMLHDWTEGKVADTHKFEGDLPFSIVFKQVKREEDDAIEQGEE